MKKSIETIWKEGLANSKLFIPPKPNNFQKQNSIHLVDKIKRMYKINLLAMVIMAFSFFVILFYMHAIWQGTTVAILYLALAWYNKQQMKQMKVINQGLPSYEYLKEFHKFLKSSLSKNEKVMKFFYPLIFLTAIGVIWFAGNNQIFLMNKLLEKFPDLIFVGGIPLSIILATGFITFLFAYFSNMIYKWDINIVYGRIFKKLEATITELEELKS